MSESTSRIVTIYSRYAENRVNGLTSGTFDAGIVFVSLKLHATKITNTKTGDAKEGEGRHIGDASI